MELLQTAPLPLTRAQRLLLSVTAVVIAVTRAAANSASLWDWDEALFCNGVREYDVVLHQPHPPGFPLYIALAKIVNLFAPTEFRALQSIVFLSAMALFPLLFWLGREAGLSCVTSLLGALLTMFLPNVWIFGGTAFSDVPGLALTTAAAAALLRGCRSRRAYLAGALVLGCAAAVRPQALIIGALPALLSTWCRARRAWRDVLLATTIGAGVVAVAYGGAALASQSVRGYLESADSLRNYLRTVDSFLNPERPPLPELLDDFFVYVIPGPPKAVLALAIASAAGLLTAIVRRSRGPLIIAGSFLPFAIFGWLMLDIYSTSRYSVSYSPLYGFLAAEAVTAAALLLGRFAAAAASAVVMAAVSIFAVWTWPAVQTVHRTISPPVAAMVWAARNVPRSATVYFAGDMFPFATYFDLPQKEVAWPKGELTEPFGPRDVFVSESASAAVSGRTFFRARDRLFRIVRQRYFEVSVVPASSVPRFGDGWYQAESWGTEWWQWMGSRAVTTFPAAAGQARLTLVGDIPTELVPRGTTFEVRVNGVVIDRFVCATESISRTWIVPALPNRRNEVVIAVSRVINPAAEGINADTRNLGFRLRKYGWEAVTR